MPVFAQMITQDETAICWTLPPAAKERKRKGSLKAIRHLAFHIPLHLIAYSLLYVFLVSSVTRVPVPPKVVFPMALSFLVSVLPYLPLYLLGWGFAFAAIYFINKASESYEINDSGCGFTDLTGRHRYEWRRLKGYRIEADSKWPSLRLLKLKFGRSFGREWPFDPAEVDEAEIRRLMEKHGIPDKAAGR